jgi:hypothetical protein
MAGETVIPGSNSSGGWAGGVLTIPFGVKFSVKHGLGLLIGIFLSSTTMASEPVPIEDRDAFEKQYVDCIISKANDNCLVSLFLDHLDPKIKEADKVMEDTNKYWIEALAICQPYAVHVLDKVIRANAFEGRSYLIECHDGNIRETYVNFRKIREGWYVFGFRLTNSEEMMRRLLNIPTLPIDEK